MTPPAARAAFAAAITDHLGRDAAEAVGRILRDLHRDGWQIGPQPPAVLDLINPRRRHTGVPR